MASLTKTKEYNVCLGKFVKGSFAFKEYRVTAQNWKQAVKIAKSKDKWNAAREQAELTLRKRKILARSRSNGFLHYLTKKIYDRQQAPRKEKSE